MYKDINFSLWCDFLERDFLKNDFEELIKKGIINGATSNPSIFKNAILNSHAYDEQKANFKSKMAKELYEILAINDIKLAASKLLKNYANGNDGFVSLEIDPELKNDSYDSTKEGKRLYKNIKMPNVMIKVPATDFGLVAMKQLIKKGIHVNATLVFSTSQVKSCLKAYKQGVKKFKKRFPDCEPPKAVISVFVSRFDRALDDKLKQAGIETASYGINNAMKAYNMVQNSGLEGIRILFASTGVKEGMPLDEDYYIKNLLLPNSVNTAPLKTIKAFVKQKYEPVKAKSKEELDKYFDDCKKAGINYKETCQTLLENGLSSFENDFEQMLEVLGKNGL